MKNVLNHEDTKTRSLINLFLRAFVSSWFILPAAQAATLPYVGDMKAMTTGDSDTLPQIARDNDIGFNELRSANPYVDPWVPGTGTKMVIPTRHILPDVDHKGIVINLPEMRLYVFNAVGDLVQTHPIGVGREGLSTPIGHTTIVRKVVGPVWRPTPRMLKEHPELPKEIGGGLPNNPMGAYAMYLGWAQYAIHGTDKPYAIGRRASSGCIRMYPEDIKAVFPAVPVGETVTVINQPVKAAWIDGRLYVEAQPPLDQAMMIEESGGRPYYDLTDADMNIILKAAGDRSSLIDWARVRSVIRNREGYPIAVTGDDDGQAADAAQDMPSQGLPANPPAKLHVDEAADNAWAASMNSHAAPPKRKAAKLDVPDAAPAVDKADAAAPDAGATDASAPAPAKSSGNGDD